VWVFHNLINYYRYRSSNSVTPQDRCILSKRFQSTQILAENVAK
jgi:hypothetical protein